MRVAWLSCAALPLLLRTTRSLQLCVGRASLATASAMKRTREDSGEEGGKQRAGGRDLGGFPSCPAEFQMARARMLTPALRPNYQPRGKCVVLWMMRDQRVRDNHALHYAQLVAREQGIPLRVVFNLVPRFLQATFRQFGFMLKGLQEVEQALRALGIPFHLLLGDPASNLPQLVHEHQAGVLVTDFSPLRVSTAWTQQVAEALGRQQPPVPMVQVDAHNVVPCWVASPKQEYSARTFRSKISRLLPEYLTAIPPPSRNTGPEDLECPASDWQAALDSLQVDRSVPEVDWVVPGETAAHEALQSFIGTRLKDYGTLRNDPNKPQLSDLSPYFHFGQLSAQAAVLKVKQAKKWGGSADTFVEEAVVRRELSDNYCFYNPYYDSLDGCPQWAQATLEAHRSDPRPVRYTFSQLELAQTHDDLWNAAQLQMTQTGKMHGFLRMYWAKKILEWTASPEQAIDFAIRLNDKYELDGRDPNGYVGCLWAIGGLHDQGWAERAIFGKVRFMNYEGCKRKFNVKQFVEKYPPAAINAENAPDAAYT